MSIFTSAIAGKVAIALLAGGSLVIGAGASAFATELPGLLQEAIQEVTEGTEELEEQDLTEGDESGEPAGTSEGEESEESEEDTGDTEAVKGPKIPGPAAYGLCNAFGHGGLPEHSTAFTALASGAAEASVKEFCDLLPAKVKGDDAEDGGEDESAEDADAEDAGDDSRDGKSDKKDKSNRGNKGGNGKGKGGRP